MANEKRLIDANSKWMNDRININFGSVTRFIIKSILKDAPTVDAVEVVHGYNIDKDTPSLFECSVCNWWCNDTYYGDTAEYNYCPNCGAKMDGDGNE